MAELTGYMETALKITKEAAQILLEGFQSVKTIDTKSAAWDLVTEFDVKIERMIKEELLKAYPTHKFIGEETTPVEEQDQLTATPTWIVDPIDGTINFVHGFPMTCICVGLAINKEMVLGVVCNPVLQHTFTAIKGRGAFLNNEPIHASTVEELPSALVSLEVSFAQNASIRDVVIRRTQALITNARGLRAIGSAALAMCFIAKGSIDVYQTDWLKCWDVAASSVIVKEAGGVVVNTDGSTFDIMAGKILCCGTETLMKKAVACIKEADKS